MKVREEGTKGRKGKLDQVKVREEGTKGRKGKLDQGKEREGEPREGKVG